MSPGVPHMGYTYLNIRFARASSNLSDFNYRNKALTAKLLRQGYLYFKLRKAFSKFYRRHSALVENYSVCLKTLLQQGISKSKFYGDLVYRFRKIVGKSNLSDQFRKLINRYKRIEIRWWLTFVSNFISEMASAGGSSVIVETFHSIQF